MPIEINYPTYKIRCESCGKEIKVIHEITLDCEVNNYPALLHGECYREISEKAWQYDQLNK